METGRKEGEGKGDGETRGSANVACFSRTQVLSFQA